MEKPKGHRLQTLDLLRGAAALGVLAIHLPHHVADGSAWVNGFLAVCNWGDLGVLLLLLLSGYCIHGQTLRRTAPGAAPAVGWRSFLGRRLQRLYPPYLVVVLICAACLLAAPWGRARGLGFWLGDLLTHAAMAHNLTADWAAGLGNGSLWSLGMEVQLYLLYLGFLALYARVGLRGAVAVVVLVAGPVWTVWLHVSPTVIVCGPVRLGSWGSWPFPCWLPWTLGALAAEVEQGRLAWPAAGRRFRTALGLALAAAVFHPDLWPVLTGQRSLGANFAHWLPGGLADRLSGWTWALAGMTLILACGELERRGQSPNHGAARVLAAVGGRSYALYLTHMPVLGVCIKVLGLTDPWGCALVGVPLALAVAWLFFRFVEQPFLEARRKAAAPEEARPAPLAEPEAVLLPFPAGQAAPETVRGRLAA